MLRLISCLAVLVVFEVAVPCAQADLVGYWTFEDDSVADLSGSGNHGTLWGDPAYVTDSPAVLGGTSLALDGTGDFVNVTQNSNLPISSQPAATISMWVKGGLQKDMRIFSEGRSTSLKPLYNLGTDNTGTTEAFDLFVRDNTNSERASHIKSVTPVFDNSWHHIAFVDVSGLAQLYVDGVLDATSFNYTDAPLTADRTTIGAILRAAPGNYFTGNIDDTAIWNSALGPSAIADLADGASPLSIAETDTETVTVRSDATWRTLAGTESVSPDWISTIDFDETGWESAFKSPSGDNIWHTSNLGPQSPNSARFRYVFDLAKPVSSASGVFGFDDDGSAFINGIEVVNDYNGHASGFNLALDPDLFQVGSNLVAIEGLNRQAPYNNIAVVLDITLVPEPSTLILLTMGAVGLLPYGWRRRKAGSRP